MSSQPPVPVRLIVRLAPSVMVAAFVTGFGAAAARGQVVFEPPRSLKDGAPPAAQATLMAGNGVYSLYLADGDSTPTCGTWTAQTGPRHEAGPGLNVIYGNGVPDTSDTTLRSWTSGTMYRTGRASGCDRICDHATPTAQAILRNGHQTGWRLTWRFDDGSGPQIEFVQEVNVEGPVDGTENVDNSVIRETHVVRNLGPGTLRYGLRKHWDWQIANDDGPYFGDCTTPDRGCDRSMDLYQDGSGDGAYPLNYIINSDPAITECPPGISPRTHGCGGNPPYIVAGTVAPPSTLSPPPDAPELLQFDSWDSLVSTCWKAPQQDAARCGSLGNPVDDTAVAYFYGATSATALTLAAGTERSFTQYVVAGASQCPTPLSPPTVQCNAGGPYSAECMGPLADLALDGTGTSDQGTPSFAWTTDCPGGTFNDPTLEDPLLTLSTTGCETTCTVTLTVTSTSSSGQTSQETCTAPVVVRDTTRPDLSCPSPLTTECRNGGVRASDADVAAWLRRAVASDRCTDDAVPVTNDMLAFVGFDVCPTVRSVTFRASDACGNVATCTRELIIVDTTAPVVTPPADHAAECGAASGDQSAWLASASAQDSCSGSLTPAHQLVSTETPCPGSVRERWRFSAADSCGNVGEAFATWEVADTTAPVLAGVPADASVECDAVPAPASVSATDACDPAPHLQLVETSAPGACPQSRVLTRTWTATDGCGNSTSRSQLITVRDTRAPSLVGVPADAVVECDAIPSPATVTATDACDPAPRVDFAETSAPGSCPQSRVLTRTWTATDACGNAASRSQVITVRDTRAPSLVGVPADATVECDAVPSPAAVSATDACDPAPRVDFAETSAPWTCPQSRILTRTWTATDACGNSTSASQLVYVRDSRAPVLAGVPADAIVDCGAVPAPASVSATDACDPAPTVVLFEQTVPGSCPGNYTLTRRWTATDACGNSASRSQVIHVRDVTPPVISGMPADETRECSPIDPTEPTVTASDTCDPAPALALRVVHGDGPCAGSRTITYTFTATDACGNSSSQTQVITFLDRTPPALSGVPANTTIECDAVPAPASVSATDACDPAPRIDYRESSAPGPCANARTITRTWTATDACGNSTSQSQIIAVRDTRAPTLSGVPANATVECDAIPAPASVSATDACDPAPRVDFRETSSPGSCPQSRVLTRTWTATDACGNSTSASQVISVRDTRAPLLSGVPADATVECDAVPAPASVTATDACDPAPRVDFVERRLPGACPDTYVLARTWTATDACGNATSREQRVSVRDVTPPRIQGVPADATVECDAVPGVPEVSATDACDPAPGLVFSETRVDGRCPNEYRLLRLWTATDRCGNSASLRQTLTVMDTQPPQLVVPEALVLECTEPGGVSASDPRVQEWLARARAWDSCPGDVALTHDAPAFFPAGCPTPSVTTVTFSAVDACGNATRLPSTVTVVDTTPPVIERIDLPGCIWVPNHRYACLGDIAGRVLARDACTADLRVFVEGCASSQPDNGLGDGNTTEDCAVAPDGSEVCLRAERQGNDREDRLYSVRIVVEDHCGNQARASWPVRVAHDQREHDCPKLDNRDLLGPHEPLPWER